MINKLFFLLAVALFFTGCQKYPDFPDEDTDVPASIEELNVSDSFSWNTGTSVKLIIQGLPTIVPIRSTLKISLPDSSVIYNRMHSMSDNLTVDLTIPVNISSLILSYGSQKEVLTVNQGEVSFSFFPEVNEE
ncbi:MAG: Uncharacterized protein FD166_1407 [Bacteroidetes bacterium]|nr:MAG: Uncharacterized protein FD166_1407 [Bacteroidota bacterium]